MKIVIWTHYLGGGGAERVIGALASSWSAEGHDVTIYVHRSDNPYAAELHEGVKLIKLGHGYGFMIWRKAARFFSFVRVLRQEKPDVIFSTGSAFNAATILAARLARACTVVVRETSLPTQTIKHTRSRWKKVALWLIPRLYKHADAVIVSCGAIERDLLSLKPDILQKIHIIPNAIDLDLIRYHQKAPLQEFLEDKEPFILGVGRLLPVKGFDLLIQAFALVRQELPAKLVLLGEGPERDNLGSLARACNVESDVIFPGFDTNPFRYMDKAALFVLSSRFEGMPNVLLQAMACDCPVVSFNCTPVIPEILKDGEYGALVPAGDVAALAAAMKATLITSSQINIPKEAMARYDKNIVAAQYLTLFRQLNALSSLTKSG